MVLFTAEHRFYGESYPFNQKINEHNSNYLGLLSIEQAMADYMELLSFWKNQ